MTMDALFHFPKFPKAKCAGSGDFFFPDSQVQLEERLPRLIELCGSCIHRADCLDYSIKNEISDGFWAGHTAEERKAKFKTKEEKRTNSLREIVRQLSNGFTKEEIAKSRGIQMDSLDRTLDRAKRKGLIQ